MKKILLIISLVALSLFLAGCSDKTIAGQAVEDPSNINLAKDSQGCVENWYYKDSTDKVFGPFNGCTETQSAGKPWCGTKTVKKEYNGQMVDMYLGNKAEGTNWQFCTTLSVEPKKDSLGCVENWYYKDSTNKVFGPFNGCTETQSAGKPWCGTKTVKKEYNGQMVDMYLGNKAEGTNWQSCTKMDIDFAITYKGAEIVLQEILPNQEIYGCDNVEGNFRGCNQKYSLPGDEFQTLMKLQSVKVDNIEYLVFISEEHQRSLCYSMLDARVQTCELSSDFANNIQDDNRWSSLFVNEGGSANFKLRAARTGRLLCSSGNGFSQCDGIASWKIARVSDGEKQAAIGAGTAQGSWSSWSG